MTNVLIIVNPSAGDERGLELKESLTSIYQTKGIETKVYETTGHDDYEKLIEESMSQGYEKVVVSGGDGTISELINGIAEFEKRPEIVLIPSGTTNNFARMIGSEKTRKEFLEAIESDQLVKKKVDLGRVNDHYFISSIAVGILPAVGWETDEDLKARIGSFAYFLEGIKAMSKEEQETFTLQMTADQHRYEKEEVILFIVGLSNSIMGIQTFFEEARIDDGKLHYFGLTKGSLMNEAGALMKQVLKKKAEALDELIFTGTLEEASIRSDSDLNFLIDGEKGPTFPITLNVLPRHLTFFVPESD